MSRSRGDETWLAAGSGQQVAESKGEASAKRSLHSLQEDHEIDHWSIVVADVQQHARNRTMSVVRVHTLRYSCKSCLNMHCAH